MGFIFTELQESLASLLLYPVNVSLSSSSTFQYAEILPCHFYNPDLYERHQVVLAVTLIPERCSCWLLASWNWCFWSQNCELSGATSYLPLAFHPPEPYLPFDSTNKAADCGRLRGIWHVWFCEGCNVIVGDSPVDQTLCAHGITK